LFAPLSATTACPTTLSLTEARSLLPCSGRRCVKPASLRPTTLRPTGRQSAQPKRSKCICGVSFVMNKMTGQAYYPMQRWL
jgi:hypothetical protein